MNEIMNTMSEVNDTEDVARITARRMEHLLRTLTRFRQFDDGAVDILYKRYAAPYTNQAAQDIIRRLLDELPKLYVRSSSRFGTQDSASSPTLWESLPEVKGT